MDLFSFLAATVFAAETALSPLSNKLPTAKHISQSSTPKNPPHVTFGQLTQNTTKTNILGVTTEAFDWDDLQGKTVEPPKYPNLKKQNYTIAMLGDSMVDTLGPNLPHLASALKNYFPQTKFKLLNYGVGGTNIEYGIERLTNSYNYLGNDFPPLVAQYPDLVIIESFGYNPFPFDKGAIDLHWLKLSQAVDLIKKQLPKAKVIIAATIAPDAKTFGNGAPGVDFGPIDKWQRVNVIKKYLENTVRFAQSQKLPLVDAFNPSLDASGNGKEVFINQGDHIHYSDAGRQFFSQKIAETIANNHLLE